MINKIFFIILLFHFIINFSVSQSEIFIKAKVNNEIITNLDIKNEKNYLTALNPKLKNLENNKFENIDLVIVSYEINNTTNSSIWY